MITSRTIIFAFLCASLAHAQFIVYWSDEEYYTTTVTTTYEIYPQDNEDAETIIKYQMSEEAFASILPYREKIRCMTIIRQIAAKNGGVEYISDLYIPQQGKPFKDLVYALTKDENMVLGGYLGDFFDRKDENWIIIAMVLTKNMQQMIETYDKYYSYYQGTFKDMRKKQRCPFEHMLRVWVRENRESNEKGDLDKNQVSQDVNDLKLENDSGGWKENRDKIEKILIKKSIKYAQAVIAGFEKVVGKSIEEVIQGNVLSHELNHDLADAYAAMASYIKNKHQYVADIMRKYCDGSDKWAVWMMCIAVTKPKEWSKVDAAFQRGHPGDSLSKFIKQKMTDDKVMAEMIAAVVDPNFKPTAFSPKRIPN